MKYPDDNPLTRLDKLQHELDKAKTQDERDAIAKRISLLKNGVPHHR